MNEQVYVNCYNCGNDQYTLYDTENGFNLVKCNHCGLLYVNPRPGKADISEAAMTGTHHGDSSFRVKTNFNKKKVEKFRNVIGEFFHVDEFKGKSHSWLDIGCGTGEFIVALRLFSNNELNIYGSEPNIHKGVIARKYGMNVTNKPPGSFQQKFNFISLLNVFSHLPDPIETLSEWKKLLLPGGELFIETGHSCHLPRILHHRPYYLPDHLSFANKEILTSILEKIGFEIIEVKIYRGEMYPANMIDYLKYFGANIYSGNFSFQAIIPKEPDRNMFIRAVLKQSDA